MNALFVKPVWGHSVGGQLFQPLPENDRKAGQIVTAAIVALLQVSSSHQTPAGPSHWVTAHDATSAYLPVRWGSRVKEKLRVGAGKFLSAYLPCWALVWPIISHWCILNARDMMCMNAGGSLNRGRWPTDFRRASDSQALGTGSGISEQIPFSTCMSAASLHFASSLTFSF